MLRIAWRNLWRRRGRTLIIGSAIALSYALMLVFMGIGDDMHIQMKESAAKTAGGDVLIHGAGYWEAQTVDYTIDQPKDVLEIAHQTKRVQQAIPRVILSGLATSSTGNEGLQVVGIDPEREQTLRDVSEDLVKGTFLAETDSSTPSIVLSTELAEKLDVELGHKVVLTATDVDGEMTRALFRLRGLIETTGGMGASSVAYSTIGALQEALGMGERLTQIGIVIEDGAGLDTVANRLREALGAEYKLEVLTWSEAIPVMERFIALDDAFNYLFLVIIFIVVVFSIANTFLMAVMERVRELGLLNAIGLNPRRIGTLIIWETVFLAIVAQLVGFALGYSIHTYISHVGIDLANFGMEQMEFGGVGMAETVMRSKLVPSKWLWSTLLVFVATVASAIYPAWKAAKLAPAKAMTFYE